jgi:hypothetical protein
MKHEEFLPLRHRTVRLKGGEFAPFYKWVRDLPVQKGGLKTNR